MDFFYKLEEIKDLQSLKNFEKEVNVYFSNEFKKIANLSIEEKKHRAKELTMLKEELQKKIQLKEREIIINSLLNKTTWLDIEVPNIELNRGYLTLITKEKREIEDIFLNLGFSIEYGHEIVSKFENFYSLNIPSYHPATEMHDTFYLDLEDKNGENLLLRTHTSSMQYSLLKKYGRSFKVIVPGRVYRFENTDASHDVAFWQLEGMVVDENISISNFKYLINKILNSIFKKELNLRLRPAYFPFVEPGFEVDISCPLCNDGCSFCKYTKWVEILGAGMIHPKVFECAGYDNLTGFAFGFGLTRLVAIKYGIKDIRLFNSGDLRFLTSFKY